MPRGCAGFNDFSFAAPLLRVQATFGQLGESSLYVGVGYVHLIQGDDNRHFGCSGVIDSLDGLRHDAIVGCNNKHDNIGHIGASGSHCREGLMPWRIEEHYVLVIFIIAIGTDALGNSTGFAIGDTCVANFI